MAAAAVCHSSHALSPMASRRVPLSNLPNGGNSPLRGPSATGKRPRPNAVLEDSSQQAPPKKKHAYDQDPPIPRTPRKPVSAIAGRRAEDRAVDRQQITSKPRERRNDISRQEKTELGTRSQEEVQAWKRHYRKAFPGYVFYFENVPRDAKQACVREANGLGAREVMFFSREVSHVITTRPIPPRGTRTASPDSNNISTESTSHHGDSDHRTINPSLLERDEYTSKSGARGKFNFDAPLGRRHMPVAPPSIAGVPKQSSLQADILQRAQNMGIKIWQLEKLQRIIATILEDEDDHPGHNTRSQMSHATHATALSKELTLEDVLREDAKKKTRERDIPNAAEEIVPLKAPYIYVFDMNEKTKPIILREYRKVERREDGDWPQFRSASKFKCPFIEDEPHFQETEQREEPVRERKRVREANVEDQQEDEPVRRTNGRPSDCRGEIFKAPPPPGECLRAERAAIPHSRQQLPQPTLYNPFNRDECPDRATTPGAGHCLRNEPMASGLQASKVTSAIRSQMISSAAAVPGAKAGTSREIHDLQRKILERNSGPLFSGLAANTASSRVSTGPAAPAAPAVPPERAFRSNPRVAKQKAQEKLGGTVRGNLTQIYEDPDDAEHTAYRAALSKPKRTQEPRVVKREPKPGYCENCREKFEDFDQHTLTKKHRKFAIDKENWKELDELLDQLARPRRSIGDE